MSALGRRARIAASLAAVACATPPATRVELCPPPAERPARPLATCFEQPDAQRHAGRLGSAIGEVLSGWHSHPGAAGLSVAFGDDGRVASLCFDSVSGNPVARRIPDVADRIRELPAAPACFAGHRLDFAWESEVATTEDVRRAVRACHREVRPLLRRLEGCRFAQHCPVTRTRALEFAADRELRACVLEQVPLTMRTGVSREILRFLPVQDRRPDPELAIRAHRVCDGLPRRADVVECMDRHGWEPRP
jgi:hypothetical protein